VNRHVIRKGTNREERHSFGKPCGKSWLPHCHDGDSIPLGKASWSKGREEFFVVLRHLIEGAELNNTQVFGSFLQKKTKVVCGSDGQGICQKFRKTKTRRTLPMYSIRKTRNGQKKEGEKRGSKRHLVRILFRTKREFFLAGALPKRPPRE